MSSPIHPVSRGLASALLAGSWERSELLQRATVALGGARDPWLRTLVDDALKAYPEAPRQRRDVLAAFIRRHPRFTDQWVHRRLPTSLRVWLPDHPVMGFAPWPVRPLDDEVELAAWLGLTAEHLAWFADRRALGHRALEPKLWHYDHVWVPKRSGGARLLEAPRPRLKALQRSVLAEILRQIPPHEAAHGFVRGRSVRTHAALHAGREVVVRFDLRAFFAEVPTPRALGVFLQAGYPENVARSLLGLCTHRTPLAVLAQAPRPATAAEVDARWRLQNRLSPWHLPQGAPTSPALANLCAFGLDLRLGALARSFGATYSRYADDLTFSGGAGLRARVGSFSSAVEEIARSEGFGVNAAKTRVMPRSVRQEVTGVVVNAHPNLARGDYDRLKAVLHNCRRHGPATQTQLPLADFRARLRGQVSWAAHLHPGRGARLLAAFDAIRWG